MPIEPPEVPPATPGNPTEPPLEEPPGNPRPEIPPPVREPGAPPQPQELPGRTPDELPVRGPQGPRTPYPATDAGVSDLPGSEPDVLPGSAAVRHNGACEQTNHLMHNERIRVQALAPPK